MDLLFPFFDNDLMAWGGVASAVLSAKVGVITYKKKHPYKVELLRSASQGTIEVRVRKVTDKPWSLAAAPYLEKGERRWNGYEHVSVNPNHVIVGTVDVNDDEADEQIIEHIVTAKSYVQEWQTDNRFKTLEKVAKNALKR